MNNVTQESFQHVFVVGAARSGTTLLAEYILAADSRISYTGEINFVWRYGAAFATSDIRRTARSADIDYIRKWFSRFGRRSGRQVILDKTPQNCLRIPLLNAAFPNSKIIHVVRDGRDVAISSFNEWHGTGDKALDSVSFRRSGKLAKLKSVFSRKFRLRDRVGNFSSFLDMLTEIPKAIRIILRILVPGAARVWGVRIAGLNDLKKAFSILEVCALQWEQCINIAHFDGSKLGQHRYLIVRYEELIEQPTKAIGKIYEFIGMPIEKTDLLVKANAVMGRRGAGAELAGGEDVGDLIRPTLNFFEYK